jgi:hypothetical protein
MRQKWGKLVNRPGGPAADEPSRRRCSFTRYRSFLGQRGRSKLDEKSNNNFGTDGLNKELSNNKVHC